MPLPTLDDIATTVRSCTKCKLHQGRTHAVPGEGNVQAEIMFIGEGPGREEDQQGRPFVGAAGRFLAEMLGLIGLKREDVFIANLIKCRPPNNRDPEPDEVQTCWPYLNQQIDVIKPKLFVLLGRHAMYHFLGKHLKISQEHGKLKRAHGRYYFVLYHPASALYQAGQRDTHIADFQKLPQVLAKVKEVALQENSPASALF